MGGPYWLGLIKASCAFSVWQVVETVSGALDGAVLERMAKILSYMHASGGGKHGKKLKKREKLRMLQLQVPFSVAPAYESLEEVA